MIGGIGAINIRLELAVLSSHRNQLPQWQIIADKLGGHLNINTFTSSTTSKPPLMGYY
jgi:hypothetical protein